jgi:hypothetical protein
MRPVLVLALLFLGCGSSNGRAGFFGPEDGGLGADGTVPPTDGAPPVLLGGNPDASTNVKQDCSATSQDQAGCACGNAGETRACYTGDPKTRHVGTCADGTQTCARRGEFQTWSDCTGDITPQKEGCPSTFDTNCNGKVGCEDPQCATNPVCNTGCTDGQTRACYDGPANTENVGTCKDGKQTCVNGKWPTTCTGEVTPTQENCCDALDHNCNGFAGCWDLFSCATSQCCQTQCQNPLDPGCVCPKGSGDTETCPVGDHVIHKGGPFGGTDECCPCTDCNDINCCGTDACKNSSACSGLTCKPLPPSCNGQVDSDCDDFPEDCDEPCCLCSQCP